MEQTILIPIDGTESVDKTLLYLRSISPKDKTRIVLMHVSPSIESVNAAVEIHPNVNAINDALVADGWKVERETRLGDPVREIIKMAILLPATMLLMSTHGRSGIERIREGSVTEQVLKQSPCPVFILHSERQQPTDNRTEDLFKKPGVAETIDWAKCLLALDVIALSPEVIADTLGAILKYQDDIAKLHGSEAKRLLDEARASLEPA